MSITIRDVQRVLAREGLYTGAIDNVSGKRTEEAVLKSLSGVKTHGWSDSRLCIGAAQASMRRQGIEGVGATDGFCGPMTEYALELFDHMHTRDAPPAMWRTDDVSSNDEEPVVTTNWPSQSGVNKFYGPAGGKQCTAGTVSLPYKMRIAWDTDEIISSIRCHELVADSVERVLRRVHSAYSPESITSCGLDLFGGCFNYRRKRGGSSLSMHSWGIAIDFDPARNQLRQSRDTARLARRDCELWWRLWSEEGWTSLGVSRNFDWMHVQAADL